MLIVDGGRGRWRSAPVILSVLRNYLSELATERRAQGLVDGEVGWAVTRIEVPEAGMSDWRWTGGRAGRAPGGRWAGRATGVAALPLEAAAATSAMIWRHTRETVDIGSCVSSCLARLHVARLVDSLTCDEAISRKTNKFRTSSAIDFLYLRC